MSVTALTLFLALGWTQDLSQQSTGLMVVPEEVPKSTEAVPAAMAPSPAPPPPKKKKPLPRSNVIVGYEAARWKPFPVRRADRPAGIKTSFASRLRLVKVRISPQPPVEGDAPPPDPALSPPEFVARYKGKPSKARAQAAIDKVKDKQVLVIAVFPDSLGPSRRHLELRYVVDEGFLDSASLAVVTIRGAAPDAGRRDTVALRRLGIEFDEISPAKAEIFAGYINTKPGKSSFNSGSVKLAEFGDPELGLVNFSYAVTGVVD